MSQELHEIKITSGPFDQDAGHDISIPDIDAIKPHGIYRTEEMLEPDSFVNVQSSDELPNNVIPINQAPSLRDTPIVRTAGNSRFNVADQPEYIEPDQANPIGMSKVENHGLKSFGKTIMRSLGLEPMPPATRKHYNFDPKAEAQHRDRLNQQFRGPIAAHKKPKY